MKTIFIRFCWITACVTLLLSCSEEVEEDTHKKVKAPEEQTANVTFEANNPDTIQPSKLHTIEPYEQFLAQLRLGDEIEVLTIEWPWDDQLCDSYNSSEGDMTYRVYRLANSKKIIQISEMGGYCQGDSEYGYVYTFNSSGDAVYSVDGFNMYVDDLIQFYKNGFVSTAVTYLSRYGDDDGARLRKIKEVNGEEHFKASTFLDNVDGLFESMQERIMDLQEIVATDTVVERVEEAENTIATLETELLKKGNLESLYENTLSIRMPIKGEELKLKSLNANVKTDPSMTSTTIDKVSYYNNYIWINEVGPSENVEGIGTCHWYKITFGSTNGEYVKGWLFGADVSPWMYYNEE